MEENKEIDALKNLKREYSEKMRQIDEKITTFEGEKTDKFDAFIGKYVKIYPETENIFMFVKKIDKLSYGAILRGPKIVFKVENTSTNIYYSTFDCQPVSTLRIACIQPITEAEFLTEKEKLIKIISEQ